MRSERLGIEAARLLGEGHSHKMREMRELKELGGDKELFLPNRLLLEPCTHGSIGAMA